MTSRTCISERLRLPVFSAVAVSVLALTGCSGGGDPQAGPTASAVASPAQTASGSASASPSAAPTPTLVYKPADAKGRAQNVPVPVLPNAAARETKESLIAFAKYWYTTLNFAYETGNFGPLDKITAPTCALCQKVRPGIVEWNSKGRWISGGLVKANGAFSEFVKSSSGDYQVTTQLEQSAGALHKADASIEKSVPGSQVLADIMVVRFVDGHWKAVNVDRLGA
ncbi:DUF6318 family protein [Arthrobacter sp. NPDC056727]|uniref:DUF6318 family protein n=1 Tax=Arthrobacter sp. NPDC056727 TaxID=3345927 RepID=UPI00366A572B